VETRRVRSDEIELAVVADGDPQRPAIVLVHGYPDAKEIWRGVLPQLSEHYRVIAYDVRGFGDSDKPHGPAAYDYEHLAADLLAVIEEFSPGRPVHLVGHDWGGIMGWEFASMSRLECRLASFTTIAGPSLAQIGMMLRDLIRERKALEVARRLYRSWYVLALCSPGGPTLSWRGLLAGGRWAAALQRREGLDPDPYFTRPTLSDDGRYGANLYRRNIALRGLLSAGPRTTHVPVQLIVPAFDRFISAGYYEHAERFTPRLVRRSIAAGHWAPYTHPQQISDWISEFVEEVEAG
jgi:pimeloyl-ACP methyl ester carboxylesterase